MNTRNTTWFKLDREEQIKETATGGAAFCIPRIASSPNDVGVLNLS
jgi:hypothetical protein